MSQSTLYTYETESLGSVIEISSRQELVPKFYPLCNFFDTKTRKKLDDLLYVVSYDKTVSPFQYSIQILKPLRKMDNIHREIVEDDLGLTSTNAPNITHTLRDIEIINRLRYIGFIPASHYET